MGNCDSSNRFYQTKKSSEYNYNYSSPSLPKVTSLKEKKSNSNSHKSKKNLSTEKYKYLLPETIAKREDITNYYKLSKNIVSSGATSLLYIGENSQKEKFAVKRVVKSKIMKKQKMLIKEAELCFKLHHKNIIKYYEIYEDINFINIVMELGDTDLFELIINSPNEIVPDLFTIDVLIQIFEVIDYLHSNNIIHCDIKPENFVLKFDKNNKNSFPILKLIDFGNSRNMGIGDNSKLKNFVGTKEYMAPEIFEENSFNEKVDEWAAGIIMFNMLTGCDPFRGESDSNYKDNILYKEINFDLIKNERLRALNKKLLERYVAKRISAREALEEIKTIKNEMITNNIIININNNKIRSYLDMISNKISLLSLS
jgi:serine/threonine protein kinase